MAKTQDKSDDSARTGPLSRTIVSVRADERLQIMDDGTHLSLQERLEYAVNLVPRDQWAARFGRSLKQLRRYLDGADVPMSVLTIISAQTGVPADWLAAGTPTFGPSQWDEWRESLADSDVSTRQGSLHNTFPPSLRRRTSAEMAQVHDLANKLDAEQARTIDNADFRVGSANLESKSSQPERHRDVLSGSDYAVIPRLDVPAAGHAIDLIERQQPGDIALSQDFLRRQLGRRAETLVSIQAEGDSMDPTIRDGDLLVLDTSATEIRTSRIYVLAVDDLVLIKRIQMQVDGAVIIKSDNPKYLPETISSTERQALKIIGQVIYQAGPVRS